jgi:hypothetical protein
MVEPVWKTLYEQAGHVADSRHSFACPHAASRVSFNSGRCSAPSIPSCWACSPFFLATLFRKWHPLSRSVWTAPYSGALTSGAQLRYPRLLLLQPPPLPCVLPRHLAAPEPWEGGLATRFTFHVSRFTHHVPIAICPKKPTNPHSPCQRQMPFAQHITSPIPRIMPSSLDTISLVPTASTHWRSACYQR